VYCRQGCSFNEKKNAKAIWNTVQVKEMGITGYADLSYLHFYCTSFLANDLCLHKENSNIRANNFVSCLTFMQYNFPKSPEGCILQLILQNEGTHLFTSGYSANA
jgi:hypothetical protein